MLTPQEIQDMKFEKAIFGGYDMAQIDKFLDEIQVDYSLLYKENTALKGKMRVLTDKIDEYRAVDDEMRKALFTARTTADDLVEKAKAEAASILANAQAEAKKRSENIETEVYANTLKLKEMRDVCCKYAQSAAELMEKAKNVVSSIENKKIDEYIKKALSEIKIAASKDSFDIKLPDDVAANNEEPESPQQEPTREINIDDSQKEELLKLSLYEDETSKEEPEEEVDEDKDDDSHRTKFVFSELKFGKIFNDDDE